MSNLEDAVRKGYDDAGDYADDYKVANMVTAITEWTDRTHAQLTASAKFCAVKGLVGNNCCQVTEAGGMKHCDLHAGAFMALVLLRDGHL